MYLQRQILIGQESDTRPASEYRMVLGRYLSSTQFYLQLPFAPIHLPKTHVLTFLGCREIATNQHQAGHWVILLKAYQNSLLDDEALQVSIASALTTVFL